MAFAIVRSRALSGLSAPPVTVEVHLANGLPSFTLVGLADTEVKEARERVRSALLNCGLAFPHNQKIVVNLAPADLPKDSGRFDLPIALGILAASGQIEGAQLEHYEFAGELSLSGELRSVRGALAMSLAIGRGEASGTGGSGGAAGAPGGASGGAKLVLPQASAFEAAFAPHNTVYAAAHLMDVVSHFLPPPPAPAQDHPGAGEPSPEPTQAPTRSTPDQPAGSGAGTPDSPPAGEPAQPTRTVAHPAITHGLVRITAHTRPALKAWPDLGDVKGQAGPKRALEIAAAGGHSVLMVGPPGSGKSMLAQRFAGLLPPLDLDQALESAAILDLAGRFNALAWGQRPFSAPHHTASAVALVGGGSPPRPGEISLAHHGVLFLDELPEFARAALEALREPLETGQIRISRAAQRADFPARFQLIAAMNPCPCGYLGATVKPCRCTPDQVSRYQGKLSGPLMDRIDLHVEVPALPPSELIDSTGPVQQLMSAAIAQRAALAKDRAQARQGCTNHSLQGQAIDAHAQLDAATAKFLNAAATRLGWSGRSTHRALKVARTIADLAGAQTVQLPHLAEAIQYRRVLSSQHG